MSREVEGGIRSASPARLLDVEGLVKHFPIRKGLLQREAGRIHAVNGVSFSIDRGETLALVGETGCGKSTVGRTIMRFYEPTGGRVLFEGVDLATAGRGEIRRLRRRMQLVFQDPYSSLSPRMTVGDIVAEPLVIHNVGDRVSRRARVRELFELVGLAPRLSTRYPHEFSGGQRQRIGIARALALDPSLLILDEPVSALDVSIQAQIINLLTDLQEQLSLGYLFISHDLAVVKHIADQVAVMYLGEIVEQGDAATVFKHPAHPYTQSLCAAVPIHDPRLRDRPRRPPLAGEVPNPARLPTGCFFHSRCPKAEPKCSADHPELEVRTPSGARSACHFAEESSADEDAETELATR